MRSFESEGYVKTFVHTYVDKTMNKNRVKLNIRLFISYYRGMELWPHLGCDS